MRPPPVVAAVRRTVAALLAAILLTGCSEPAKPTWTAPTVDYAQWRAGTSQPVADPLFPQRGNPGLDVLHYGLELSWDPSVHILTGKATLRIRPVADAAEIRLDFKSYTLDSVTVDGSVTTGADVESEKLVVPVTVRRDKPVTLVVGYHGAPLRSELVRLESDPIRIGMTTTKDGSLWTMQEPFGAFTWYPANDHPSDRALYYISVTPPSGWTAIAGGTPVSAAGGTFRFRSSDPIPPSMQTLAVGKYQKLSAKGPRGIPLTFWYRPGDNRLLPSLKKSPEFLTFLEKILGRYPFPTGGVVLVDSAATVATQQMITMGGRVDQDDLLVFDGIVVHEFAHQWFGVSVTPATWNELWLNEGWATYVQYLYLQGKLDGDDAFLKKFLRARDAEYRKKFGPPARPKYDGFAEDNVFLCTAAMLNALHGSLGDRKFFALATAWVAQRNTVQTRASFIAFVNRQTGRDFTKLINAWLDDAKTPGVKD